MLEEKQKILTTHKAPKVLIDDIFADVGKYVPVGALDEGEVEDEKEMKSNVVIEHTKEMDIDNDNDNDNDNNNSNNNNNDSKNEVQTVKGLFKNLIPSFPSKIKMSESTGSTVSAVQNIPEKVMTNAACVFDDDDDDDDNDEKDIFIKKDTKISSKSNEKGSDRKTFKDDEEVDDDENEEDGDRRRRGDNKDDLMAPIRALLAAQSAKEKAALLRSEERASHRNDGTAVLILYVIHILIASLFYIISISIVVLIYIHILIRTSILIFVVNLDFIIALILILLLNIIVLFCVCVISFNHPLQEMFMYTVSYILQHLHMHPFNLISHHIKHNNPYYTSQDLRMSPKQSLSLPSLWVRMGSPGSTGMCSV
jgi:hypothetical protein